MLLRHFPRLVLVAAYLAAVAGLAGGVWFHGYRQALDQAALRGGSDLALASDRLTAQLRRYQELAVVTSDHPYLAALHDGGDRARAEALLLEVADKAAARWLVYADRAGRILAASDGAGPESGVAGAAFRRAMTGALGTSHGRLGEGLRAYVFAAPSFAADGAVQGALIVVLDIEKVEAEWRGSRPAVFFTDARGEVFVTNRSEMLFWQYEDGQLVAPDGSARPAEIREAGGHEIWRQDWSNYVPQRALHLVQPLPVINMRGEALVDVGPARRLAALQAAVVAAVCLTLGAMLFLALERRRTLALANAELERRVARRTRALTEANTALRREVAERQEAVAALKRAQADLVQAGKLSALGQMSAGISHELNQPLMAIRSFAENGAEFVARGKPERAAENLGRISELARRMGRIIRNLRAFARQESEPSGRVDVVAILQSAVELTESRLARGGIALHWQPPPAPVWVTGGEVRLGQVFVNLIVNAADAMEGSARRELFIELSPGDPLTVTVRDTGPGIEEPERIFDPFYSTKAVGSSEGMGLGLSISYGLVQSFGGTIRGGNAPGGGAVFSVELEPWREEVAA